MSGTDDYWQRRAAASDALHERRHKSGVERDGVDEYEDADARIRLRENERQERAAEFWARLYRPKKGAT